MYNLSSAQGARFAEVCEEMTEIVKGLGPSPLAKRQAASGETALIGVAPAEDVEPQKAAENRP